MEKCGIYIIEAISGNPNKIGQKYVGKTKNLFNYRKYRHFQDLEMNCHVNPRLSRYYNKYGKESLKFTPLMECSENELNFWEKWWIKCFDSHKNGFNCTDGGENNNHSFKRCILKNVVTGEIGDCESIVEFSKKYNVNKTGIAAVLREEYSHCGQWILPKNIDKQIYYKAIDTNEKEYTIWRYELVNFCRRNNLKYGDFLKLMIGQHEHSQGWKRPDSKDRKYKTSSYKLISPDGKIYQGDNISKFCKENTFSISNICSLVKEDIKSYKGWKKYKEL